MPEKSRVYCYPDGTLEVGDNVLPPLPDACELPLGVKCTNNGRQFTVWGDDVTLFGEGWEMKATDVFKLIIAHIERLDRKVAGHGRSLQAIRNHKKGV